MSKPDLILIGAGGHALACIDVIEQHSQYNIAGIVGLTQDVGTRRLGYPVIATDDNLAELAKTYQNAIIAVGQITSADNRIRLYQITISLGFCLPIIIAPTAYVSHHATIGPGSVIMHSAIVNAGAKVGNNCIIDTRAIVEHDAVVEDHCHISTGVILNGQVKIGAGSFVGSGSIIKECVFLGRQCIVGMGLCVRHNQADNTRFVGSDLS